MYKVYWIKDTNHTDPYYDGYVGITSREDVSIRFDEHKNNHKNKHLRNRCRMGGVEIIVLHENLSTDDAKKIEFEYRPTENIGWNIACGGDIPPSRTGRVSGKNTLLGNNRTEKQMSASKKWSDRLRSGDAKPLRLGTGTRHKKTFKCLFCGVKKYSKENRAKYCSIKCAAANRNKNDEYRKGLSDRARKRWADDDYKKRVSISIRKSLRAD